MTKETLQTKTSNALHYLATLLLFGLIVIALLSGAELVGIVELPNRVLPYIGGALIGYVVVASFVITHLCAKFMFNKKG